MWKQFSAGNSKPAALMLSPEAPYPVVGGGPLRTASVLEYLAQHYTVDIVVFREPGAADPRAAFPSGVVRRIDVVELPYHSKAPVARAARNLKRFLRGAPPLVDRFARFDDQIENIVAGRRYDLGVIEHFWCARYRPILHTACERVWLDLHNIESVLLRRCAEAENWAGAAAMKRFAHACRKLEQRWLPGFEMLLVTSESDRAHSSAIAPTVRSVVYPNTLPLVPRPDVAKDDVIVFSGNLEYHPNVSALRYFFDEIWPLLRNRWPSLQWHIVGKNEHAVPERIRADRRVKIIGPVDDAVEALARARCAVVPLLAGSGTRIKIIEAWAAGLPVVSTRIGVEGLPGTPGEHLLVADDPAGFARAVSSVLEFPELAHTLGANGRELYEADLTWQAAWERLQAAEEKARY